MVPEGSGEPRRNRPRQCPRHGFSKKVFQDCEGGRRPLTMYFATRSTAPHRYRPSGARRGSEVRPTRGSAAGSTITTRRGLIRGSMDAPPRRSVLGATRHLRGMPRRWRQRRWRRENHHGIPPNKRRQAVQRLGSTSIGVLRGQCLDRRIATRKHLVSEIAAWQRQRNHSGARIKWTFTIDKATSKIARAYPETPRDMASQLKES